MTPNPQINLTKKVDLWGEPKAPFLSAISIANLVDHISDALIAVDNQGLITGWNAAAERIYGWKADEVIGEFLDEFLRTEFGNIEREDIIKNLVITGSWSGEVIQRHKDGKATPIWSFVSLIKDERGSATGSIYINQDFIFVGMLSKAATSAFLDQFNICFSRNICRCYEFVHNVVYDMGSAQNAKVCIFMPI